MPDWDLIKAWAISEIDCQPYGLQTMIEDSKTINNI